jgi:hypothetical protein
VTTAQRIRRLETCLRQPAAAAKPDFARYRTDPAGYCRDVLRVTLTSQQVEVCDALIEHKWVLVPSANEVGKSFLQACIASWHYDCFNPCQTIVTAPAAEQIRDTVFTELRMLRPGDPDFMPSAMVLSDADWHWVKGYTARHGTSFQGRHKGSVLINFEEAEEIPLEFWTAADSMAHYFLAWYNPITTNAETVNRERNGRYKIVRLSALDHPNIAAGLAGEPPPIPAAITLPRVIERLDKWATRIDESAYDAARGDVVLAGRYWQLGPVAEARVCGRRPTSAVGTVFSQALIDRLLATRHALDPVWPLFVGLDPARFGDDSTAIHVRRGLCSVRHESHNGWTAPDIEARVKRLLFDLTGSDATARLVPIHIDAIGIGGPIHDHLIAAGYNSIAVTVSKVASTDEYPNIRSQLWFDGRALVEAGLIDVSRIDASAIVEQLLKPGYEYDGKGRQVVDAKKVTKAALGRSPDDADAFLLAYYSPPVAR